MNLYSRSVLLDTPKGQMSFVVTDTSFLSRSRASFAALDECARVMPRNRLSLHAVGDLVTRPSDEDRDWSAPGVESGPLPA